MRYLPMRYLPGVIDEILETVPHDRALLRERLLSLKQSARYTAPEGMVRRWMMLSSILTVETAALPESTPWLQAVDVILNPERN